MLRIIAPRINLELHQSEVNTFINETLLENEILKEITLRDAEAKSITIDGSRIESIEISASKLKRANISDTIFNNCLLFGSNFDSSSFLRTQINQGMITGIALTDCVFEHVVFRGVKMNLANFRASKLTNVQFIDCDLTDADYVGATLKNVEFIQSNLAGVDFSNTIMTSVDLRTSDVATIKGLSHLKGSKIDTTQLMQLSGRLAAALDITVDDPK